MAFCRHYEKEESMFNKRLGSIFALFVLLAFPVSASMVCIVVVETGLNHGVSSGQYTSLWEDGFMSVFFDAGHIVSNFPSARMDSRPALDLSGVIREDFIDAVIGGADFFILCYLDFSVQGGRGVPAGIEVKIYSTHTGNLIHEQRFPAGSGRNLNEEYQMAQSAARTIVSHLSLR